MLNDENYEIKRIINENKIKCKRCGSLLHIANRKKLLILRYTWCKCWLEKSLKSNTFLKNTDLTLNKCLYILKLYSENISVNVTSNLLDISRKTSGKYKKLLDIILIKESEHYNLKIGGPGIVVEIDESKFGRRKYNKRHPVDGVRILGMIERTTMRRIELMELQDRRKETLHF